VASSTGTDYRYGPRTIDYRCNDGGNSWVGATSWFHYVAEDSRIPKIPVINPLQALFHLQTQKKKNAAWIVKSQFLILPFWYVDYCRLGIMDFNLTSNGWVSLLQKSKFAVLLLRFKKLGLELDNSQRTTKTAYCHIYSLCLGQVHCLALRAPTLDLCLKIAKSRKVVLSWIHLTYKNLMSSSFSFSLCQTCTARQTCMITIMRVGARY
jgi:hypothetical protein